MSPVSETVPDSVLDLADEIVLVDLTPEQLRSRLAEGKVYLGERAEWAAQNFFRESNLTALREMALRLVAEHVDRDLRDIMSEEKIAGPWKSGDRLLVAVSASPYSERLIRYTRRLAASMEASWIVANIEQPRPLSQEEQTRLTRYLALARQLGAEVISTPGTDIGEALLRIAREHNVTQIVIGKPLGSRWTSFLKRDPLRWLMRNSGNIDIHMIPADESVQPRRETIEERLARAPWRDFGVALGIAGGRNRFLPCRSSITPVTGLSRFSICSRSFSPPRDYGAGRRFFSPHSARLLWDFLFIPPRFTFYITHFHDFMMFGAYFVIALVIGHLATQLREREQSERRREERATALYRFTRALAASRDLDEALPKVLALIKESFPSRCRRLVARRERSFLSFGRARSRRRAKTKASRSGRFRKNRAPENRQTHLPDAEVVACAARYRRSRRRCADRAPRPSATLEQRELLDAFAAQLALFVNKERALEESRDRASCPAIPEITESTFRFRLTRIEDTARRDVGCIATESRTTRSRGVAAGGPAAHSHGRSFARRDPPGIRSACNRCANGAIRPSLVREAVASSGLKDSVVRINIARMICPRFLSTRV